MTKPVTMIRAYYNNPKMLKQHLKSWNDLPSPLAANLSAIFADDCSQREPAENVLRGFKCQVPIRLLRIDVDIRWNWLGARNRAMHEAPDGWCLITDMDHFAPEDVLLQLVSGEHDPETIYRFSRIDYKGNPLHEHPNSWFMTKEMFWRVGGFNEAASGFYGTDGHYRRRVAATAPVVILPLRLVRFEGWKDASTTDYQRKQPQDANGKIILKQWGDRPPKVLSFPWHEVKLGEHDGEIQTAGKV